MNRRTRLHRAVLALALAPALLVALPALSAEDRFWVSAFEEGEAPIWQPADEKALAPDPDKMIMYEVTRFPEGTEPTEEQRAASADLVARARAAAERNGWYEFQKAVEDGYELIFADHQHYVNKEYLLDENVLDPDRPEFLMYYETPRGPKFAGFMFMVPGPDDRGPQIGGPETIWHYHLWPQPVCLYEDMYPIGLTQADGTCAEGTVGRKSPEMMHVWTIEHPDSPFATGMTLTPEVSAQLLEPPSSSEADPHCPVPSDTRRATTEGVGPDADYVPPRGTRFRNDWNGSVYDRKTGLVWEVKTDGSECPHCVGDTFTWSTGSGNPDGTAFTEFLDRLNNTCNGEGGTRCVRDADCEGLGRGFCGFAGAHDWRLPTEQELIDLAMSGEACTAAPCIDPSMPGETQSMVYWTSSASPRVSTKARAVFFDGRGVTQGKKTSRAYVRAVRGP